MSLRAIQKRDRNKLSSAQQKQQQLFINKGRGSSFVGTPLGGSGSSLLVSSTGSIGASSNNSNNNHHHHLHHQQPGKNEKWRNSSSSSSASLASASTGLTHAKRSVSYPSLQKRTSRGSPSSSLRFSKSESDLQDSQQSSPGGTTTSPNHHHQHQLDSSANNLLYLGAKSEVCLKTLAVKSTHQPPAPFQNRSGGGTRGGNRMYESNNNGGAARRPSDFGGALDKLGGTGGGNNAVRIPIIGYEVMEERARFTIFKLRIENSISHTCWLVLRRYTDFVRLNNRLRATFPHCQLVLPRKKWFGDNFSSGFIDNRIQGLQTFINTIMGDDAMRTSPPVREFFCLDEPPAYSESMEESRIIFEAQEETIAHLKQQLQTKDELVAALQAKLASEMNRNKVLTSVIRNSFENCSKCAKQLDNHLKEAAYK